MVIFFNLMSDRLNGIRYEPLTVSFSILTSSENTTVIEKKPPLN